MNEENARDKNVLLGIEKFVVPIMNRSIPEYSDEFLKDLHRDMLRSIARKFNRQISDKNIIELVNIFPSHIAIDGFTQFLENNIKDYFPEDANDKYTISIIKLFKRISPYFCDLVIFYLICEDKSFQFTSSLIDELKDFFQENEKDFQKEMVQELSNLITTYVKVIKDISKYEFVADLNSTLNIVKFSFKPIGKKLPYEIIVIDKSGKIIISMELDKGQTSFELDTDSLIFGRYIAFLNYDQLFVSVVSFFHNDLDSLLSKNEPTLSLFTTIDPLVKVKKSLSSINFLNKGTLSFNRIYFISDEIRKTIDACLELANRNVSILITGGAGSGKKLFVQMIHNHSEDRNRKITIIKLSAKDQDSHIEKLHKISSGTIIFENIQDLTHNNQNHLLHFIHSCPPKVRLIFVSSENLSNQELRRNMRIKDSFYINISRHSVEIPLLKDRGFDFLILIWHFIQKSPQKDKYSITLLRLIDFIYYDFPGNVNDIKWYCNEKIEEKLLLFDTGGFKSFSDDLIDKLKNDGCSEDILKFAIAKAHSSCNIKKLIDQMILDKDIYTKQYSKYEQVKILLKLFFPKIKFHEQPKSGKKLRPSQKHRLECRKIAEKIWANNPSITIPEMIQRAEIKEAADNIDYRKRTMRNWIKNLCPNRSPGRRPKKPK
ncbi:sigma 54-interacting transcriptional regulator [candidate division KSB1 bacterium]